ncbi:MAG: hypothetical protein KGD63_14095 [Candidatus Lokiarchaeota archaeon]|nr:hypothetical protein [Candidatus Lokiarchaeota archaeon]
MVDKNSKVLIRKDTINLRRKYGRSKQINIIERDAYVPEGIEDDIKQDILRRKAIIATDVAVKYDVRVSTIKLLLAKYAKEGLIKLFDPSSNFKIYVPI